MQRCVECPHLKYLDAGLAVCDKYNIVRYFTSQRQLNKLECKGKKI